jgi:signal transduction histidine kinase
LLATLVGVYGLRLTLPIATMLALGVIVVTSNAGIRWAANAKPRLSRRSIYLAFTLLDWAVLLVIIQFTGGVESPAVLLVPVQVLLTSILLPGRFVYFFGGLTFLGVGGIAIAEATDWLPHHNMLPVTGPELYREPALLAGSLGLLAVAIVLTVVLFVPFLDELETRKRQVDTLYQGIFAVSSSLELPQVLDRLVRGATTALEAEAASIQLLDPSGTQLSMTAAYGLSKRFMENGSSTIIAAPLDQVDPLGRTEIVDDVLLKPDLAGLSQFVEEDIRSFLSVPLQGRHGPLGVLRVYGRRPRSFGAQAAEFGTAIARQGAAAIENAMAFEGLRRTDQLKSQFVRAVTHELRSPVAVSQSLLRVVIRQIGGSLNDLQRDILSRLSDRLDALQLLIDDLLDLAAGKVEGLEGELTPVSVESAVLSAIDRLEGPAAEKNIRVKVNSLQRGMTVVGSEEGLGRVFINVIGNAIKYTPAGGEVNVRMERRSNEAAVTVTDTGIGIPEVDLPHLFDEFYRASNAKETGIQGTGLGLAIVKDLVERYNGHVSIQSQIGQGTTVSVGLPLSGGPIPGVQ